MKIYISGPMTGYPEFNYPAFRKAAEELRKRGWVTLDPTTNFEGRDDLDRPTYMRADVEMLLEADAIYMLKGWPGSKGAKLEMDIADELGLYILYQNVDGFCPVPAFIKKQGWHRLSPTNFDHEFVELMKNRVDTSFHKYGDLAKTKQDPLCNRDEVKNAKYRIYMYLKSGNPEYLVDAANFLMFEYSEMKGKFIATDCDPDSVVLGNEEFQQAVKRLEKATGKTATKTQLRRISGSIGGK